LSPNCKAAKVAAVVNLQTAAINGYGTDAEVAQSGNLTLTQGANTIGTYNLETSPSIPPQGTSALGAFYVDNLFFSNDLAGSAFNSGGTTNDSYLTYWGLVFESSDHHSEVNIWGNGGLTNYELYEGSGAGNYSISATGDALASPGPDDAIVPSAAPTPAASISGLGLLAMFGVYRLSKKSGQPKLA
jgi:hypothetical protein